MFELKHKRLFFILYAELYSFLTSPAAREKAEKDRLLFGGTISGYFYEHLSLLKYSWGLSGHPKTPSDKQLSLMENSFTFQQPLSAECGR